MPLTNDNSRIHFCRYCGKTLETKRVVIGFFTKTVEKACNCSDFVLNIEITKNIDSLEKSRPKDKFEIRESYSIEEIKN